MRRRTTSWQRLASAVFSGLAATWLLGPLSLPLPAGETKPDRPAAPPEEPAPTGTVAPQTDAEIVAEIDRLIATGWSDAGLEPAAEATPAEWCRRVYLDLVGRIPSSDELAAYERDKRPDRRAQLINKLLDSDDYIYHQATVWTNLLIGRRGGTQPRSLINRAGMQKYLRDSIAAEKPYDVLVRELITATGVNKPGEEGFNGAVNFLLGNLDDEGVQATAVVSRLFLGMQVQCTQCHNHPFNDWKQNQFWGMNAFFRQARPLRTSEGNDILSVQLIDQDFAGEDRAPGATPLEAAIYYDNRDATLAAAFPTFVDGTEIGRSGYVDDVNRRGELAQLVLDSEYLAPAAANRAWSQFFTYGFTKPVDDMGPHNPTSHPELLAHLAGQFAAHGYDLRTLHRWIVSSRAYGLSSRSTTSTTSSEEAASAAALDDPAAGTVPLFSRFYLRQMTAEQLYESLIVATAADEASGGDFDERQRVKDRWLAQFSVEFGTDDNAEANTFNGTIPQALMMMNGPLVREATACKPGTFLHETATGPAKNAEKIVALYRAALSRDPRGEEVAMANKLLQAREGNVPAALEDVWWVLLNSGEFILVH